MATDYISREAAEKAFCRFCSICKGTHPEKCEFMLDDFGKIPAADVVEVVRCKDCRFYYEDEDGYEMCDNSEGYDHISADGFCAWAKRSADNG